MIKLFFFFFFKYFSKKTTLSHVKLNKGRYFLIFGKNLEMSWKILVKNNFISCTKLNKES